MVRKKDKTPKPKRDCSITFRLTNDEFKLFKMKANAMFNSNVSKMIIYSVGLLNQDRLETKYNIIKHYSDSYQQLMTELKRHGTNINQVAHQLNAAMIQYNDSPPAGYVKNFINQTLHPILVIHLRFLDFICRVHDKKLVDVMKTK